MDKEGVYTKNTDLFEIGFGQQEEKWKKIM